MLVTNTKYLTLTKPSHVGLNKKMEKLINKNSCQLNNINVASVSANVCPFILKFKTDEG